MNTIPPSPPLTAAEQRPIRRILMIAYHFPPLAGSSGIQRTLRFVQHLGEFGWQPIVLTAQPHAYERTSEDLMSDIPSGVVVERAFALDTARHLSIRGRYIAAMARPDRWVSWRLDGVRRGLQLVRRYRPDVIWSTYPIATAHLIGAALHRHTGLPWVADFRDPMAQDGYPPDPVTHRQFVDIETEAMRHAALNLFTTPGAARVYRSRYPEAADRIAVLENGYDEESFAAVEAQARDLGPLQPGCLTLLHSGIVYPEERDPTRLMEALQRLHAQGVIAPGRFRIRFRAPVQHKLLDALAARFGVSTYVEIVPAVGYRDALLEMLRADGLLLLQAANCNEQIPAKAYEYLRAGRPIICLADPAGDTAGLMRSAGVKVLARLDSTSDIADALATFLNTCREGGATLRDTQVVLDASRRARTQQLCELLQRVASPAHLSSTPASLKFPP
jgi:glycosyltransferase involved in cell wall biosynthesis